MEESYYWVFHLLYYRKKRRAGEACLNCAQKTILTGDSTKR